MKYFASLAAFAAVVPALVSGLTVNTITTGVNECEPVLFTWNGGVAPYFLSLVPNKDTSAAAIKNFGQISGTSYTWTVDLAQGTSFTTVLKDSTGANALSDQQTVASGSGTSCVNTSVTESGGSVGTASATAATNGASTAAASTTGASAAKSSGSASGSASSSAAKTSSTNSSNGAGRTSVGAFGLTALMGLVGAALF
ncbi:uncharacterized protein B0H18DRAFT_1210134 [Fomitopsis serialis]|uniref:uncharacterized protein n=1 Tax=Fomitopsis serialis TaxID=139415 RepID=UPI002008A2CB|nr:uncharacterized protein B0H18DRAFT_1051916 [Neoantrodia serialis]XP_047894827.1 uncharacterized protein B0H18DRAFT_1210134 [Neoantrodia serialis]KAH9912808.1 hypothetical protein B0H18DRAFT_1051916 [Neoantrodia serialis]KAH9928600.1 hypothetical protein B0H18DRAFT_1210134 [Neoantrodia serialis]